MPRISSGQLRGHSPIQTRPVPSPLERELVPVGGVQVISDLERPAVWIVVDVQHPDQLMCDRSRGLPIT
jgi:hypothetical protein